MPTAATAVLALAATGAGLQWLGVADGYLTYITGRDLGINGAFWFRFLFNMAGLAVVTAAIVLYLPQKFRLVGALLMGAGSLYLLMLPGYYRIFDGPLAEYDVKPWEIILKPYQEPEDLRRGPTGYPGPELARNGRFEAVA